MAFSLGPVGQIALGVADADCSEAFFDYAELRLLLEQGDASHRNGSPTYFRVADIVLARRELEGRGVVSSDQIRRSAPMEDCDLWMTFFNDPDGHVLALMMEAPKGWTP